MLCVCEYDLEISVFFPLKQVLEKSIKENWF